MCMDYSWILRDGFERLHILKFKIIETSLFLALFYLCIFVILMDLLKSHILLISSFFNRIILLEFFCLCIDHYIVRSAI